MTWSRQEVVLSTSDLSAVDLRCALVAGSGPQLSAIAGLLNGPKLLVSPR